MDMENIIAVKATALWIEELFIKSCLLFLSKHFRALYLLRISLCSDCLVCIAFISLRNLLLSCCGHLHSHYTKFITLPVFCTEWSLSCCFALQISGRILKVWYFSPFLTLCGSKYILRSCTGCANQTCNAK